MKIFIALCFLAALCAAQVSAAGPLDQLKYQLDRAKSNVNSIISDLRRTKNLLSMNTQNQLSNLRSRSFSTTSDFVNAAQKDIRAQVDAAKAEEKDVENCFTTAKDNLDRAFRTANQDLQGCQQNGERLLQVQLNLFDTAIATGNKYIAQLDRVFLDCYSSNIMQMQFCISVKLGTINSSIRMYESEVATVKRNAQSGANQAYLAANSCSMDAVSKARSATTDVRIAANRCVSN